jgi:signal transduction histidine kinase
MRLTPRSLRGQVLLASVLWSVGIIFLASFLFTLLLEPSRFRVAYHVHRFLQSHAVILAATVSVLAAVILGRRSLASVDGLRGRLGDVQSGKTTRMEGRFPAEVQPLVDDLNALIEHRERAIDRAIAKAGDLAHGLKTPLALLAQEADRAGAAGQPEIAAAITQHVDRMRRQVDYHLVHARAAASGVRGGSRSVVRETAEGLARTLRRLHADRTLTIDVQVPPAIHVNVRREDLEEMLGNLMDNACKWAAGTVVTTAAQEGAVVTIAVDDNGGGLPSAMREAVLRRGVRADEAAPGSGLGLAIVADLAELYGGSVELADSPLGGLRATLRLPTS